MAKKIHIVLTLQLPAGKATPARRHRPRPQHIDVVEFTKAYNEKTADKATSTSRPTTNHLGPPLHVHPQDATGGRPPAQGGRGREGQLHGRSREVRPGDPRPGPRDRQRQDGRPQRQRRRRRDARRPPVRWVSRSSARLHHRALRPRHRRRPDVHPTERGRPGTPTASTRTRTMAHGKRSAAEHRPRRSSISRPRRPSW